MESTIVATDEPFNIQQTPEYWIVTYAIICITGPASLFFVLIHLYQYYKKEIMKPPTSRSKATSRSLPLHREISILTIIMIIFMSIGPIWGFFIFTTILIDHTKDTSCFPVVGSLFVMMYYIGKGCMYLIFIMRLHSVYSTSAFGYKPWILKLVGIIVCITTVTLCVLTVMNTAPEKYEFIMFGERYIHCNLVLPQFFIMIYALHEIIITVVTLVAFIRPLKKLLDAVKASASSKNVHAERRTFGFKLAAIKVTILSITAILSSFMGLVIAGTTDSSNIFYFDMPFNVLCIMLMTSYYTGWYKKLCCCCINTCICCCLCDREAQRRYINQIEADSKNLATTKSKDTGSGITNKRTANWSKTEQTGGDTPVLEDGAGSVQVTVTPMTGQPDEAALEMSNKLHNADLPVIDESMQRSGGSGTVHSEEVDQLRSENEKLKEMLKQMETKMKSLEKEDKEKKKREHLPSNESLDIPMDVAMEIVEETEITNDISSYETHDISKDHAKIKSNTALSEETVTMSD